MNEVVDVQIVADDVRLAGHLRVPAVGREPLAALVFTGPFTGVKEQVVDVYAQRLSEAGFVTLVFDHRNFGGSEGYIRQHEDAAGKLADLRAATSMVAAHEAVDASRIGCVGICLGGGYALRYSAFDPRIRAVALVAAAFNDPKVMRRGMGDEAYRATMASFAEIAQRQDLGGPVEYMAAVSDVDGAETAMPGTEPWEYYGTERSSSGGWRNQVTRLSIRELLTFDAAIGADFIAPTPTLIVHGRHDNFCPPSEAQAVYERITGPKEMMWIDTSNHVDLYDVAKYVDPAVERVARWMGEHLGGAQRSTV